MMANLTYAQLEGEWIAAGGSAALAPIAAAIAEAESGGNPAALNANDSNGQGGTQSSYGLWQISNGTHTPPNPNWNNPLVNAQLAVAKYNGAGGWSPWGTYTSGAYKAFLSNSTTPDTSGLTDPTAITLASQLTASQIAQQGQGQANCAWSIGWGGIPGTSWLNWFNLFGGSGNIGSGEVCLISKPQVRGIVGVGVMGAGLVITMGGIAWVLAPTALHLGEDLLGIRAVGKIAGMLGKAGSSVTGNTSAPPPPVYSGNSPSGSTPPPVTVINRPPAQRIRRTGPASQPPKARTGGRTQQGQRKGP